MDRKLIAKKIMGQVILSLVLMHDQSENIKKYRHLLSATSDLEKKLGKIIYEKNIEMQLDEWRLARRVDYLFYVEGGVRYMLYQLRVLKKLMELYIKFSSGGEFKIILKKYRKSVNDFLEFRDDLEHLWENRVFGKDKDGNDLDDPVILGQVIGDKYDEFYFGGKTFKIKDLLKLEEKLHEEVYNYLEGLPELV